MEPGQHDPRDIPILTETARAQLPELVDRILREHAATREGPQDNG